MTNGDFTHQARNHVVEVVETPKLPEQVELNRNTQSVAAAVFPGKVRLAAFIWILVGAMGAQSILSSAVLFVANKEKLTNNAPARRESEAGIIVFLHFGASAFILAGIRFLLGAARSSTKYGVASIIIAIYYGARAVWPLVSNPVGQGPLRPDPVYVGFGVILGAALLIAGVMALEASDAYYVWRNDPYRDESVNRRDLRCALVLGFTGLLLLNAILAVLHII